MNSELNISLKCIEKGEAYVNKRPFAYCHSYIKGNVFLFWEETMVLLGKTTLQCHLIRVIQENHWAGQSLLSWFCFLLSPLKVLNSTISWSAQPGLHPAFTSPPSSSSFVSIRSIRVISLLSSSVTSVRKLTPMSSINFLACLCCVVLFFERVC